MTEPGPVLTDADQRLLEYLRVGTLDAEIAVRMGVPVGDVKDRIARLVHKLNVTSRAELVGWSAERWPAPPAEADDTEGVTTAEEERGAWWGRVALLVPLLVLGAIGAFVAWGPGTGDKQHQSEFADSALTDPALREIAPYLGLAPTPTQVSPGVQTWNGIRLEPLQVSKEATIANGQLLLVRLHEPTDTFTAGIDCVYVVANEVRHEPVFRLERVMTEEEVSRDKAQISHVVARPDGSDIVVTVCIGCAGQGVSTTATVLFRSRDFGVTWENVGRFSPPKLPVAALKSGEVLLVEGGPTDIPRYELYPSGTAVEIPRGAMPYVPLELADGILAWRSFDGRLVRGDDGQPVFAGAAGDEYFTEDGVDFVGTSITGNTLEGIVTSIPSGGPKRAFRGFVVHPAALRNHLLYGTVVSTSVDENGNFPQPLPNNSTSIPAAIDLTSGNVHPFGEPFAEGEYRNKSWLLAVGKRPDARVNTPGDCLNLREQPRIDSGLVECLPHGSWLNLTGPVVQEANGARWLTVGTLDLQWGYVAAEFVEKFD